MNLLQQLLDLPLQVAVFNITIQPVKKMKIGIYPAMTIRGGLGYALRKIACGCTEEPHKDDCLYAKLYEELEGAQVNGEYIPYTRPFIVRTGVNHQHTFKQQDSYTFELVLFGDAISHLDYFIIALKEFGRRGIGEERDPFIVTSIEQQTVHMPTIIFENGHLIKAPEKRLISSYFSEMEETKKVKVHFTTPLRLKSHGYNLTEVPIDIFTDHLCRRLKSLLYFHHNGIEFPPYLYSYIIEETFNCELVASDFQYEQFQRFSTRQKQQFRIDGITGSLVADNVSPIVALLWQYGQLTHVGKQTVFGLGEYTMVVY